MKRWSAGQLALMVGLSAVLWALLVGFSLMFGSTGGVAWPADSFTLRTRLESRMVASLVGAALAAAGVVYQAVLRNPLAEPYLLGVSSGASLAVYLWALPATLAAPLLASFSQQSAAFVGGLGALAIVFVLAQRRGRLEPVRLLLVGVIVNAVNGALFLLAWKIKLSNARSSSPDEAFSFLVGGIKTNLLLQQVAAAGVCVGVGFVVLFWISGQLNVATLSEAEAESLGVRIHRLRWVAMIVASLVTAAAMALSGPIGFVGLVCPHLGRLIVGNDQRRLLPLATAMGAGLLAIADVGSRRLEQMPVGVLTGFLGGPFFLFLLWRSSRAGKEVSG